MSPRLLVARWRRRLLATVVLAAAASGGAAGMLAFVIGGALGASPRQAVVLGMLLAVATAMAELGRRLGGRLSLQRVALWLEERAPSMQYALVSAIGVSSPPPQLTDVIVRADIARPAWSAVGRALLAPGVALVVATGALLWPKSHADAVGVAPVVPGTAGPAGTALERIQVVVRPPSYTGRAASTYANPEVVRPLAGSVLTVEGARGDSPAPVVALVDSAQVAVVVDLTGGWRAAFTAPPAPTVLQLRHAGASRLVAIEPQPDSAPTITLLHPARDTVLRAPQGRVALEAHAEDDIGLATASFEYIVSSGEGERFTFTSGTVGARRVGGRAADLRATLDLESLGLQMGDVIHLRAVARDGNPATGAGFTASDTRTFRVARAGEYDSIAVEAAPPPEAERTLLSQRMLINLTETLVRRSRALGRADVVSESRRIGRDQARLRKQVSDLVFSRLGDDPSGEHFHGDGHEHAEGQVVQGPLTPEQLLKAAERATQVSSEATDFAHDETPVVAINRPLLEAYNAMWDAGRELDAGEPRLALPPMYAALAAIQKARAAERLYLRGVPPRVVIDLSKVRLQGRDRGNDASRVPQPPVDEPLRAALDRLHAALSSTSGSAAADSLLLIRLSLVGTSPTAAAALDALIADLRAGRDATASLLTARRALDATTTVGGGPSAWGRIP